MAKAKANKSQMVRDMLTKNPTMPVKDVVTAMGEQGMRVTSNLVYFLRAKMRARKRRMVRRQIAGVVGNKSVDLVSVIVRVKAVATEVGGLAKLKQLVEVLAE
jgi:hypothetical protein